MNPIDLKAATMATPLLDMVQFNEIVDIPGLWDEFVVVKPSRCSSHAIGHQGAMPSPRSHADGIAEGTR